MQINEVLVSDVSLPATIKEAIERKLRQEQESLEYEFRLTKPSRKLKDNVLMPKVRRVPTDSGCIFDTARYFGKRYPGNDRTCKIA